MSIRAYKLVAVALVLVAVFFGWRCFTLYQQMATAAFIDAQCENTQVYIDTGDPRALAHHVGFLIGYYEGWSKTLARSPIAKIARRDYQQALTNAVTAFRRMTTNDLGSDPQAWIEKYGH